MKVLKRSSIMLAVALAMKTARMESRVLRLVRVSRGNSMVNRIVSIRLTDSHSVQWQSFG